MTPLSPPRARLRKSKTARSPVPAVSRPRLEYLEDRTLLSTIAISGTQWTPIGPAPILNGQIPGRGPVTGRVEAIAASPSDPNTIYIGASDGGVWKTTDGGDSWSPLTDNQASLVISALAIAPSNSQVIYAGTGEPDNSGDSYYGRGILKSTDGGASWTLLTGNSGQNEFDRRTISSIVVDPTNPNIIYAAVGPDSVNGLSGNKGVWKSTDGGTTWTNTTASSSIPTNVPFTDLIIDPRDAQHLYAAAGNAFGDSHNGIYVTTNGGTNWSALNTGGTFPTGIVDGRIEIAIAPSDSSVLYASISDPANFGLFKFMRSLNGGATWDDLTNNVLSVENYLGQQGWYDTTLAVDPHNPGTVYAGGAGDPLARGSMFIATNNGNATSASSVSFADISGIRAGISGPHADHHAIGFDAAGKLLVGDDGGIWRLDTPSLTAPGWADINGNLNITTFTGVALDPTNPSIAYGGSQDNGTEKYTGVLGWGLIQFGDGGYVRVDPNNPQTIYHTFFYTPGADGFIERSDDGGSTWTPITNGINLSDPGNFYVPYVIDPSNSSRLLLGTDHLYESLNKGASWTDITHGTFPNVINAIAVSPSDPNTIYVTVLNTVWITRNDGQTWSHSSIGPNPDFNLGEIYVDPTTPTTSYVVADGFFDVIGHGKVWKSIDGAQTWINITGNLPDEPTKTITIDPRSHVIFIGTDIGVFASSDDGLNWSRYATGLPNVRVTELVLNTTTNILAAATYGRGMWEISLIPSNTASFSVIASTSTPIAGHSFTITVSALTRGGAVDPTYAGTVHFTSSDFTANLPLDYQFTSSDAGIHTFTVTLTRAGNQTITASDSTFPFLTGSASVLLQPDALAALVLQAPSTALAGVGFNLTVLAVDQFQNLITNYAGTVHFTSTDSQAGLPPDYTFQSSDNGAHTFSGLVLQTLGFQTITASDSANQVQGHTSLTVTLVLDHFLVLAQGPFIAGSPFSFTVTAESANDRVITNYVGIIHFTSTDPRAVLPSDYTFATSDNGVHTFTGLVLKQAGGQTITVADTSMLTATGTASVTVSPGAASSYAVSFLSQIVAGNSLSMILRVFDAYSNVATNYTGTVHVSSTDAQATLPANYSFAAADAGVHTFSVTLRTSGAQTVTFADTVASLSIPAGPITVQAAAMAGFALQAPPSAFPGGAFSLTVAAVDPFGNTITGYGGLVHFSSSDGAASLPADYQFAVADQGVHTFTSIILQTAGPQTITVTDTSLATLQGHATINVSLPAASFRVVASVASLTAGTPFTITVTALDNSNAVVTQYLGTVHFTSTDGQAILPANYTFSASDQGVHTFTNLFTLKTAGSQTLTATDFINTSVFGNTSVTVNPGSFAQFGLQAPSTSSAGASFTVTVTAQDLYGNTIAGYVGTVAFTSTDPQALLPGPYHFQSADHGAHTFTGLVLKTVGSINLTVTDQGTGNQGTASILVTPAGVDHFTIQATSTATAGIGFQITVTAFDIFENVDTNYVGTAHFTSTDPNSVLPGDYAFQASDHGLHTFGVTLRTEGAQTITVADLANLNASGQAVVSVSAAGFAGMGLIAPASTTAGTPFTITVLAVDAFGNSIAGYLGTVHLGASDGNALLPPDYQFQSTDHGIHTFSVTLKTAGTRNLTVVDLATDIVQSAPVLVTPAPIFRFVVATVPSLNAGASANLTTGAEDFYGNIISNYAGTVSFHTSDTQATLPPVYQFVAADQGVHTFFNGALFRTSGTQTIDATDGTTTGHTSLFVNPGPLFALKLTGPTGPVQAGAALAFTVRAVDTFGNTVLGYAGTVAFSSTNGLPALGSYTFQTGDQGVHTFVNLVTPTQVGSETLTINDFTNQLSAFDTIGVIPGPLGRFVISTSFSPQAGVPFSLTVTAEDLYANTITNYTGTVHFSSTDPLANLPGNYKFQAAEQGVHTFTGLVLRSSGFQSITVSDHLVSSYVTLDVLGSTLTHFQLTIAATTTAGSPLNVTVAALDSTNAVVASYAGTIHFTTTDGQAALPLDYTFTAADHGVHTFVGGVVLKTAGSQSLTVLDTSLSNLNGTAGVLVSAAGARQFALTPSAASVTAGAPFSLTVAVEDAYGNAVASYLGTAHFTSSDPFAGLPNNYTFQAGDHGLHTFTNAVTLGTAGLDQLAAFDPSATFITGSTNVHVTAGAATHLSIQAPAFAVVNRPFTILVYALDLFDNQATTYLGLVHFSSTDPAASLPGPYQFQAGDNGVHSFSVSLQSASTQTVTATDSTHPSITGHVSLQVEATTHFRISAAPSSQGGAALLVTVTALTAANTTDTGYAGTVHFTSTDALATLPADYQFQPGDTGTHIFSIILRASGTRTLTVTDTGTGEQGTGSVNVYAGLAVTGADQGGGPEVVVFNALTGAKVFDFMAYDPHFFGGVRVTLGDVTGDGIPDIITAPGPSGGPDIRVWDGRTGALVAEFMAYDPHFLGGVNVAAADFNGDGFADIVTAADAGGGPHVQIFSGKDLLQGHLTLLASFFAYSPTFSGGVRVAVGDVNHDGVPDVITAPGPGMQADIRVFDGAHLSTATSHSDIALEFTAYPAGFFGGAYVAAGDTNGDGYADIITGAGAGGGPQVEVFSGKDGSLLQSFMAYAPSFTGGVRVAVADVEGDGDADLLLAPGLGNEPQVFVRDGVTLGLLDAFFAYNSLFEGGVSIGGV